MPWARAVAEDGGFKPRAELEAIYRDEVGLADGDDIVAYCRIGERSSHTWFVLQHLLGFENVRNYDGSWTEWGSAVRVPIATGDEPGRDPRLSPRGRIVSMTAHVLPDSLAEIRDEFLELPEADRLQLLLEFSNELPPSRRSTTGTPSCGSESSSVSRRSTSSSTIDDDGLVAMHATAPKEAPTTRGFASILAQGITGLTRRCRPRDPGRLSAEHRLDASGLTAADRRHDRDAAACQAPGRGEAPHLRPQALVRPCCSSQRRMLSLQRSWS